MARFLSRRIKISTSWSRQVINQYKKGRRDFRDFEPLNTVFLKSRSRERRPNFNSAKLTNANFEEFNFARSILRRALLMNSDFSKATFEGADLRGADLTGAKLREANLSWADLRGANFTRADLQGADLQNALLIGANFSDADLSEANLKKVIMASDSGVSIEMTGARLVRTEVTEESESTARASFLELATVEGLETIDFGGDGWLADYLYRAFAYVHRPDVSEANQYPDFFEVALSKIKALKTLYSDQPPENLIQAVQTVNGEIVAYLKRHPEALYQIKWRVFEEIVAELLAAFGWQVDLTRPTKDGGYDIFAVRHDAGLRSTWIIECKHYKPENKVGIDIARSLYGVKADLKIGMALLATTSHFTKDVHAFKASRYDFELRDFEGILDWVNAYRPNPDGRLYIKERKLVLPGDPEWRL